MPPAQPAAREPRTSPLPGGPPRILFTINVDWFFLSHRLPLARAARDAGAEVHVACTDSGKADRIRAEGLRYIPIAINRSGTNSLEELRSVVQLVRLYRQLQPDLIHQATTKAVLYGTLAARLSRSRAAIVNTIAGMGYVFAGNDRARSLKVLLGSLYRLGLGGRRVSCIFQNRDDLDSFTSKGIASQARAVLIRGAGVDRSRFRPAPEPSGKPVVMLASRMLWDKGVGEFVDAARRLRRDGLEARFVLVGASNRDNPAAVPEAELQAWVREGVVEWWGHRDDVEAALASCTLFVLPSYREGLPKVLQEAAATRRALVTTDVPGCREVVQDGVNGFLVPARDPQALARAIRRLIDEPETRQRMARTGFEIASREFAEEVIVGQTVALYQRLLSERGLSLG